MTRSLTLFVPRSEQCFLLDWNKKRKLYNQPLLPHATTQEVEYCLSEKAKLAYDIEAGILHYYLN